MNSSLYIGATGMKGLSEGMQVTSNNLANVSTIGYKRQDILFSDMLSQTQATNGNWWNAQEDSRVAVGQVGQGLQVEAIRTIHTSGALESTNSMTDLAISGKGFFQVSDDS
ncbi:MAG: flagellar hook-basal body complex protein, partial [Desulfovibrio sp.]|nr:flagellar hook-basal body complex protein [Desulfovibrio sp.]